MESENTEIEKRNSFYKEMYEVMVQNAPVSMYILEDWFFSYVNDYFCEMIGYTREEFSAEQISLDRLIHPDDVWIVKESVTRRMEDKEINARYRVRALRKDGTTFHIEVHARKTIINGKAVTFGTVLDVTEEVQATLHLKENQERFKSLYDNNPDAVFTFNVEGNFINANPGCKDLAGYDTEELLEMSFISLIVAEDLDSALYYFGEALQGNTNRYEIAITRKDGERRELEVICFPMNLAGEIAGAYGIAKDITNRNAHRKLLEDLVFYDPLTKLPNRKLFEDRLSQVFKISDTSKDQSTVLFLDLDRFKFINDSLGHGIGDEFLKIVSERLVENVRYTDTVARFSGDEFAILLPNLDREDVIASAKRLNQALAEPFEVKGHSLTISASIGIASFSLHGYIWGILALAGTLLALYIRPLFGLSVPKSNDSVC